MGECERRKPSYEYEKDRKDEIRALGRFLKGIIWDLPEPYEVSSDGPEDPLNPRGVLLLYLLRQRFTGSDRDFLNWLSWMRPLIEFADLRKKPSKRTLNRIETRVDSEYLKHMHMEIITTVISRGAFAPDKTGLKKSKKLKAWSEQGVQGREEYVGFHAIVSFTTELIMTAEFTRGWRHESITFQVMMPRFVQYLVEVGEEQEARRLQEAFDLSNDERGAMDTVEETQGHDPSEAGEHAHDNRGKEEHDVDVFAAMCGDGGYPSRANCELVARAGGRAFFTPPANATSHARGSLEWKRMMLAWKRDREAFLQTYHTREIVEAIFWSFKTMCGDVIRSRVKARMQVEFRAKIIVYNAQILVRNEI